MMSPPNQSRSSAGYFLLATICLFASLHLIALECEAADNVNSAGPAGPIAPQASKSALNNNDFGSAYPTPELKKAAAEVIPYLAPSVGSMSDPTKKLEQYFEPICVHLEKLQNEQIAKIHEQLKKMVTSVSRQEIEILRFR